MTDPTPRVPTALVALVWALALLLVLNAGRAEPVPVGPHGDAAAVGDCLTIH